MLQRLFRIMRKTGHRVVVVDPDTERAYVLLPFSVYEDLLDRAGDEGDAPYDDDDDDHDWEHIASAWNNEEGEGEEKSSSEVPNLTQPDLIDTINRDIAAWRAEMAGETRADQMEEAPVPSLDDLTLTPIPGEEAAPTSAPQTGEGRNGAGEEEKFYIEPV